jgi:hypothetical protein
MHKIFPLFILLFSLGTVHLCAQKKEFIVSDSVKIKQNVINPLAPARAAFLSAILPGLGQAYNKKYWKIPIVIGAIGTSVYFYMDSNKEYNRFREAYKQRLVGEKDEFAGQYSDETLIRAQKLFQRNRDLSLLITLALYALNIVEANVNAHLMQFNVSDDLTFKPEFVPNNNFNTQSVGFSVQYKF